MYKKEGDQMQFSLEKRLEKSKGRKWIHYTTSQTIIPVDGLCYRIG